MDPLSITASAIALGGLAATIGKGIKTLKSLGKIPDEFCALLNELTMLQLVAQELDSIPSNHSSTTELDILRQDLVQTVKKLQDLASRFETSGKGLDSRGRHRIPRIQWTRERSNIESLREQARRTRDYISAYLATVNMSERYGWYFNLVIMGRRATNDMINTASINRRYSWTSGALRVWHLTTLLPLWIKAQGMSRDWVGSRIDSKVLPAYKPKPYIITKPATWLISNKHRTSQMISKSLALLPVV